MDFLTHLSQQAALFLQTSPHETVRIIAHHDSDGIAAAAILSKMLTRMQRPFSLRLVPHLGPEILRDLRSEPYSLYIVTDIGSSNLSALDQALEKKTAFVLDHHLPKDKAAHLHVINPWYYGIDGSEQISSAGISYLFAKACYPYNADLSVLALLGAIGDLQHKQGFQGYNREFLELAVASNQIQVVDDLLFYGGYSRPLHKVLEFTTIPHIPGVSGSALGALKLLKQCNIPLKKGKEYTKLYHLTPDEKEMLVKKILERNPSLTRADLVGPVYLLTKEPVSSPIRDAREFSTMLNACGRLDKASVALGACLDDAVMKSQAIEYLQEYKRQITDVFSWFEEQRNSDDILVRDNFIFFNAKDAVSPNIISVITTIIAHTTFVKPGMVVMGMAREGKYAKVSMRLAPGTSPAINLVDIMKQVPYFTTSGGHRQAAGGIILAEDEDSFVTAMADMLDKKLMEEIIT
ncbi:MAG: DHH family phosphoesterase [Candidatus Woesearchaeota archaeon]